MNLQELSKNAATGAFKLVGRAREEVEKRLGGGNGASAPAQEPAVEPTKAKTAKPKATPKKPAAKKTAAKKASAAKTDGLDDAVDRAQSELHKRDVESNSRA